jgi:tRNA(His) 5'-end guanylyltransferase
VEAHGGDSDEIFALMDRAEDAFEERTENYSSMYLSAAQQAAARVSRGCVCR